MMDVRNREGVLEIQGGVHIKVESEFKSTSTPSWSPETVHTQIDAQDAYEL
jgi:hypothetical protein